MASCSLMDLFTMTLLILLFVALSQVTSANQDASRGTSLKFLFTNGTAIKKTGLSAAVRHGRDAWCPAVCPGCPACPPCQRPIPPGYKFYENFGYYKMHYEYKNWPDAKGACEREGGYMAVLNSQNEANLVSGFMTKYSIDHMVIGFYDVTKKGKYVTVLGDPLSSTGYSKWKPGEPNNVGKENCGFFYSNRGLNDGTCNYGTPFLCELFV